MFGTLRSWGIEIWCRSALSPYVSKRSQDWIKVNAAKSDDFVVVGFLPAKNGATGFSALLLAQYRGGDLTYAGRVGGGFGARDFKAIEPELAALERADAPAAAPEERGAVWLAPGLVIQVKFKQRTPDGSLQSRSNPPGCDGRFVAMAEGSSTASSSIKRTKQVVTISDHVRSMYGGVFENGW